MDISLSLKYDYLNDKKQTEIKHGARNASVIFLRLEQIKAAATLEDLRKVPGRWHELSGNHRHTISADLVHPLRLLFIPDQPPETYLNGNSMIWSKIHKMMVKSIENTH